PRSGVTVTITGPATDVQLTDINGCAFFGYEPVGGYNIKATAPNYVDINGNDTATDSASIGGQTVATKTVKYDDAGQVKVNFKTTLDGSSTAQDTSQSSLGVFNS